jgi:hypothetical protein
MKLRRKFVVACPLLLSLSSAPVFAEPVELHCQGVNYLYASGIGTGPAKREAAQRSIKMDQTAMSVEWVRDGTVATTSLVMKYGDYQGFIPGNRLVFDTPVVGDEIEIESDLSQLEIRYLLVNEKRFLSFTGNCKH